MPMPCQLTNFDRAPVQELRCLQHRQISYLLVFSLSFCLSDLEFGSEFRKNLPLRRFDLAELRLSYVRRLNLPSELGVCFCSYRRNDEQEPSAETGKELSDFAVLNCGSRDSNLTSSFESAMLWQVKEANGKPRWRHETTSASLHGIA